MHPKKPLASLREVSSARGVSWWVTTCGGLLQITASLYTCKHIDMVMDRGMPSHACTHPLRLTHTHTCTHIHTQTHTPRLDMWQATQRSCSVSFKIHLVAPLTLHRRELLPPSPPKPHLHSSAKPHYLDEGDNWPNEMFAHSQLCMSTTYLTAIMP